MKTVHLPGFTAEQSVYVSGAQYNVTAANFPGAIADVRPQRGIMSRVSGERYGD